MNGLAVVTLARICAGSRRRRRPFALETVLPAVDPKFERCASKNAANLRKHGVAFDEAASAFQDPFARVFDDLDHSTKESRELLVGYSDRRLLVVAFTTREGRVRVISARRATYRERKIHEEEIQ